jgi:hypothetical protein
VARLIAPALKALVSGSVDYAGIFPPASLSIDAAVSNYRTYRSGEFAWLLGRFVVSESELPSVPGDFDGVIALLSNFDHPRASAIETKTACSTAKPTYCEVPLETLDEVLRIGSFAKLRAGGISPDAIPSVETVAQYIHACSRRGLPFKATAGLHHPIRSSQRLIYGNDPASAVLHGFINFLMGSAIAWKGGDMETICLILNETDPAAFRFDDSAHWRDSHVSLDEVIAARHNFVHSFGSCSFAEPVCDLQRLGWL